MNKKKSFKNRLFVAGPNGQKVERFLTDDATDTRQAYRDGYDEIEWDSSMDFVDQIAHDCGLYPDEATP